MTVAQTLSDRELAEQTQEGCPTIERIYREQADFVWACLQRFGVREADLDDVSQEVFVVVYRRLSSFRGDAQIRTWLYAISLRVAAAARRRLRRRCELELNDSLEAIDQLSPEQDLSLRDRRRVLDVILDELDLEKRALIVMFEIDELGCDEIAAILGVPIGTVYSRLHTARRAFEKSVQRFRARLRSEGRP